MRSRLLVALTGTAALIAGVIAATTPAVATSGTPPAIPGTSSNFQLVGHNPLYHRGMNAAATIFGNYLYVGNRSDGSNTCPDGTAGCNHPHPGILILNIANPAEPDIVGGDRSAVRWQRRHHHARAAGLAAEEAAHGDDVPVQPRDS